MLRRKPPRRVACSLPCFAGTHCARYNLSQVEHLDPLARRLGAVVEHDQAVWAGDPEGARSGGYGLLRALEVHALADPLLQPHARPAGAAAEPPLVVARHLPVFEAGNPIQDLAGFRVDAVVPTQVTGIVISEELIHLLRRLQPALLHEPGEELCVVDDFVVASEVRVLVSQGVEAMRAIDDYLPY